MLRSLILALLTLPLNAQSSFPDAWTGTYAGTMLMSSTARPADSVTVEFTLAPLVADSVWQHRFVFKSKRYGDVVKDYRLVRPTAGDTINYLLDEQNGAVMEETFLNDAFYGIYQVGGSFYATVLRRLPDGRLLWDLFGGPTQTKTTVIPPQDEQGEPTEVEAMKPSFQQTVYLRRRE